MELGLGEVVWTPFSALLGRLGSDFLLIQPEQKVGETLPGLPEMIASSNILGCGEAWRYYVGVHSWAGKVTSTFVGDKTRVPRLGSAHHSRPLSSHFCHSS